MKKNALTIALVLLIALFALQACSPSGGVTPTAAPTATAADTAATAAPTATVAPTATQAPTVTPTPTATASGLVLTLDELAQYNGKNGQPAYIAVDGVIYDVTNVPQWRNGDHNGFTAGNDLTVQIKTISPHGVSKLVGIPIVGKLAN